MKVKGLLIGWIVGCFLVGGCAPEFNPNTHYLGFHFKSKNRKKIRIDFEQYHNLIVVPVRVNDSDTLNFVLDTGVGYTLITDPEVIDDLSLDCLREVTVAGAGEGNELKGCIVNIESIRLQGVQSMKHNVIVLEEDVLQLSSYAGVKVHGIIGYDLFSRFVVRINYLSRKITLIKPEDYTYKQKWEVFPISIEKMKPYIEAEAVLPQEKTTPVKLILDTGAGHSLSLETGSHPNIQVPQKNINTQIGMTLNGAVRGSVGRIPKFRLGSYEMQRVITAFPDSNSLQALRNLDHERQGNLGCGVLKRFHLIFDYPHERLILKPNRSFKDPFEFSTSGIELLAEGPNFNTLKVGAVRKDSPAHQVGIRKGDTIVFVDNNLASKLTLSEAYKMINKKAGQKTRLILKRWSEMFMVSMELSEPI